VDGDAVRPGLGVIRDGALGPLDHQVHVNAAAGLVHLIGNGLHGHGAERDRGHEVPVHHVHVD
jgi:hypothetical protein